jgi:hypothetical protein
VHNVLAIVVEPVEEINIVNLEKSTSRSIEKIAMEWFHKTSHERSGIPTNSTSKDFEEPNLV